MYVQVLSYLVQDATVVDVVIFLCTIQPKYFEVN